jgi:hypothetical protein
MSIELHIERLVLDEAVLGSECAPAVRAAIEHELCHLLAAPDVFEALRGIGNVASVPPAVLPVASHPREQLGPRIATAVRTGLGIASVPVQRGQGAST